jgi:NADH-quinone oxidoreductase subunit H
MLEQLNVFSGYNINYDFTQSFLIQDQYVSFFKVVLIILLLTVIQLVMVIVAAGISSLLERKVFASVQRRQGPAVVGFGGIYQFIADGVKLLLKEVISPYPSTYVTFILAPMLVFIVAMLGWVFIPNDFGYVFVDLELNALWSFTFSSLGVYGLILAGWSSNSKYSFLGSLRSAAQMVSYEVSLGFIIICVALVSGSYNFTKIVLAQHNIWFLFALWPLAIAFYISILAETNRAPFDLPEAEAELVAGYNLEYSAIPFALFFLGEYSSMLLMSSIFILFFLGGWFIFPDFFISYLKTFMYLFEQFYYVIISGSSIIFDKTEFIAVKFFEIVYNIFSLISSFGSLIFAIKITCSIILFVLIRASYPRYRYDHLMSIGWKIFLPLTLGFVLFIAGILKVFNGLPLTGFESGLLLNNSSFISY